MQLRLCLLGSPQLESDGAFVSLPIDRPMSLAFYLLLRGDWVLRSELVYMYYPDTSESLAQSNFRKLVHRLKQHPWAANLEAEATRLRLGLPTDVGEFRAAILQKDFETALALYQGKLLEGVQFPDLVGYEAWLELERQDMARAWRYALLEQVRNLNARQGFAEAEQLLLQGWRVDPTDEELVQELLRTLQAAKQTARALEVFVQFKKQLQEIGATPLETTQNLVQMPETKRHNLPQLSSRFVGRKRELTQFKTQLENPECRLLCVVGLGGVGKTRFALEAVRQHLEAFPDGVWFVPLVGVETLELLISTLATAVGLQFSGANPNQTQLLNFLRHKNMLLLLDNFEQLAPHTALLESLMSGAPDIKMVVTSRLVLGIADEWLFDLGGLAYPPWQASQNLEDFEAVQLFVGQVARRSSGFVADQNTLAAIAQFCRHVQGMPLALELAAAWTRSLGVLELLPRLEARFVPLLEETHQDPFLRQRNLQAILEYTFGLLSPSELAILQRLSVFSGSFSLQAAQAVAGAHLGHLLHLINLALLQRTLNGRFELHELVRQFAANQLEPASRHMVLEQKSQFFTEFMVQQSQALHSSVNAQTTAQCRLELGHVLESLEYSLGQPLLTDEVWHGFLSIIEILGLLELGLASVQRWLRSNAAPQLLALQAYFAVKMGEDETARLSAEACLALASQPNWLFHGVARYSLGIVAHFAGQYSQALLEYQTALEIFRANQNTSEIARIYNRIGVVYNNLDQLEKASQHFQTALELAKTANDLSEEGLIYNNHGIVYEALGQTEQAKIMYTQALEICKRIGYLRGSSAALTNLGHLSERARDYTAAKDYYEQSIVQKKIIGEPIALAISQTNLADVLYQLGESRQANQINLQTLQHMLAANALMYAARVVWSFCKHLEQGGHNSKAAQLAFLLSQDQNCEQWLQTEATEMLEKLQVFDLPKLEFATLLEWLKQPDLLEL